MRAAAVHAKKKPRTSSTASRTTHGSTVDGTAKTWVAPNAVATTTQPLLTLFETGFTDRVSRTILRHCLLHFVKRQ